MVYSNKIHQSLVDSPHKGQWSEALMFSLICGDAPGMPGTFSPPTRVSDPDMHHGTCVTHVPWCIPGSLTSGFLWSLWRGKRSRHSRCMRNPNFSYLARGPYISVFVYIGLKLGPQIRCCVVSDNMTNLMIVQLRRAPSATIFAALTAVTESGLPLCTLTSNFNQLWKVS